MTSTLPEVWLRGPVPGIPALLQPVAHGLLQCAEELRTTVAGLPAEILWRQPPGAAAIGFHVRHAAGSLDRLFTYARGERLTAEQRAELAAEAAPAPHAGDATALLAGFDAVVQRALAQLAATSEAALLDVRGVGRAQLPSTVLGLLFHAAEHTQRHVGQAVTTARILSATSEPDPAPPPRPE